MASRYEVPNGDRILYVKEACVSCDKGELWDIMQDRIASETSSGSRRKIAPTASRDAGLAMDLLQPSVETGGNSGTGPRRDTANKSTSQEKAEPAPRFLIVKRVDESNFDKVSPFVIAKILFGLVGNLKNIRKIKEGLLVETVSKHQALRLLKLEKMGDYSVFIEPHRTLNSSKGVVYCSDFLNCSVEEIQNELQSEGVIEVKRIKTKKEGELVDTANHILTFNTPVLPSSIKAAFYSLKVRPYIPSPLRCYNCQRFGHINTKCPNEPTCVCGKPPHVGQACSDPMLCINCSGQHSARYKDCPKMKEETAIQNIRVKEKLSYQEARRRVLSNNPSGPSYAQVVTKSNESQIKTLIQDLMPSITQAITEKVKEVLDSFTEQNTESNRNRRPPNTLPSEKRKKRTSSGEESNIDSEVSGAVSDSTTASSSQPKKRGRPSRKTVTVSQLPGPP